MAIIEFISVDSTNEDAIYFKKAFILKNNTARGF